MASTAGAAAFLLCFCSLLITCGDCWLKSVPQAPDLRDAVIVRPAPKVTEHAACYIAMMATRKADDRQSLYHAAELKTEMALEEREAEEERVF